MEVLGTEVMAMFRPHERYRGMVEGFPRWPPLLEPAPPTDGDLLTGAIDWLTVNMEWLEPPRWEQFLARRPFPGSTVLEVLTLCRSLRRGPRKHQAATLTESSLDVAERMVTSSAFLAGLYRADTLFTYRIWLLALLDVLGRPNGELHDVVQGLLDAGCGAVTNPGRPVHALVELSYVLKLGGYRNPLPQLPELIPHSMLATGMNPLYLTDSECYVATHLLFYLTDFADRPAGVHLPGVADLVTTLLGVYLAKNDFDLSAELLLCALALGQREHDMATHGWRRLTEARRSDGAVPGPLHDPAVPARLNGAKAAAYLFGTCYHTTVVAALAAAEWERLDDSG
jgi:hypothetical protein